jgi:hypothetical protein
VAAVAEKTGGKPIEVWFADEARIGQKNKITRRRAKRGTRPSAPRDQRTASAYILARSVRKKARAPRLSHPSRLPSFSDGPESIGKDREFGEHRGEPFDQRQQSHLRHCGDQFVEHAALTKQRMGASLGGV